MKERVVRSSELKDALVAFGSIILWTLTASVIATFCISCGVIRMYCLPPDALAVSI
jgi:hypothetical protein